MIYRLIIFLIINFSALFIGVLFTGGGVNSTWYDTLNKAPWTPPGWVFGFAWTFIMICFSFYLAFLWPITSNKTYLIILFVSQWILNVSWNPTFFYFHNALIGLIIISCLTILIGTLLLSYWQEIKFNSLLILPYFIWLIIATSLNAYIHIKN